MTTTETDIPRSEMPRWSNSSWHTFESTIDGFITLKVKYIQAGWVARVFGGPNGTIKERFNSKDAAMAWAVRVGRRASIKRSRSK